MSLQKGKSKGNRALYYHDTICFNCFKQVNLKNVISSKIRVNYRYIICDCGQIMKVVKNNNEENLVRIKRNGKEIKEAYELFFIKESNKVNRDVNEKKTFTDFIQEKKKKIEAIKKAKRKSKLKLIK